MPPLFDRPRTKTNLSRALSSGFVDFLVRHVADELQERLGAIKRDFDIGLDWGTPMGAGAKALRTSGLCRQVFSSCCVAGTKDVVADEEALPFASESLSCIVSLLVLQQVNDLPGCLIQARRALKKDGLFMACLLGGETLKELRSCLMQAESEISGGVSPRVAPFADIRDMGGLLQRAGFALPVVDMDRIVVRYANPVSLCHDLRQMGMGNALSERSRTFLRRDVFFKAMALYQEQFSDPDGKCRATFDCLWLSGWAPDESQQKPLKPGSARMRLAEALKVPEQKM